ncbi:YfiM family protein [bacterium]|nr:YfiM family protein [bacterium]
MSRLPSLRVLCLSAFVFLFLFRPVAAQQDSVYTPVPFEGYDPHETHWQWENLAIVGGVLGATVTGIHIYQQNAWWQGQRGPFHFVNDPDYALNVDKAGHFYGGAFGSWLGQKSMVWSGASQETAVWGGFALGSLFELYVEFEDGFATGWGFSPGDAYADVAGAAWPVLQHYVPYLSSFQPKFTYWPSDAFINGTHKGNAIDDYEGQTYWMGIHMYELLPPSWQDYWPSWLGIAVGISIRNMHTEQGYENLQRNVIIALDYDMREIIPGDSWLLHTLKEALNFIHFPSPAIRISPNYIAYGIYF